MKYIYNSIKGLKRDRNQDRILILDEPNFLLFAVFDGVSSNQHSYLYIEKIKRYIEENFSRYLNETCFSLDKLFYDGAIYGQEKGCDGASTLTVLYISKQEKIAKYINIGDSRLYIFSNTFLEKVTVDDSYQNKNIFTKYLGAENINLRDFETSHLDFDNNFLICSDGFYSVMHSYLKDFFTTINFKNMGNIGKKLEILQANKNIDDSTYILIKNEI